MVVVFQLEQKPVSYVWFDRNWDGFRPEPLAPEVHVDNEHAVVMVSGLKGVQVLYERPAAKQLHVQVSAGRINSN